MAERIGVSCRQAPQAEARWAGHRAHAALQQCAACLQSAGRARRELCSKGCSGIGPATAAPCAARRTCHAPLLLLLLLLGRPLRLLSGFAALLIALPLLEAVLSRQVHALSLRLGLQRRLQHLVEGGLRSRQALLGALHVAARTARGRRRGG